jgi:polar amino acid transport system permease protein
VVLGLLSLSYLNRPHLEYVLVGQNEGLVAIIRGTPGRLSESIQRGRYAEDAPRRNIRAVVDAEAALQRLESGVVGAAFLPANRAPTDAPVLWRTTFLPGSASGPGTAFLVFSAIFLMLAFAGWQSGKHPLAIFAELYVDMIRGIPMLVIILYIGFPIQGAVRDLTGGMIEPSRLARGIVAIALGYAAYMAEIFRAGIQAVPRGQTEASRSLGLTGWQTARYVVLPQALRIVIPPLGNEFIAMLKDTSLLSLLSLREITQRTREFAADTFEYFPAFNSVAVLYIGLTLAASSLLKSVERRSERPN